MSIELTNQYNKFNHDDLPIIFIGYELLSSHNFTKKNIQDRNNRKLGLNSYSSKELMNILGNLFIDFERVCEIFSVKINDEKLDWMHELYFFVEKMDKKDKIVMINIWEAILCAVNINNKLIFASSKRIFLQAILEEDFSSLITNQMTTLEFERKICLLSSWLKTKNVIERVKTLIERKILNAAKQITSNNTNKIHDLLSKTYDDMKCITEFKDEIMRYQHECIVSSLIETANEFTEELKNIIKTHNAQSVFENIRNHLKDNFKKHSNIKEKFLTEISSSCYKYALPDEFDSLITVELFKILIDKKYIINGEVEEIIINQEYSIIWFNNDPFMIKKINEKESKNDESAKDFIENANNEIEYYNFIDFINKKCNGNEKTNVFKCIYSFLDKKVKDKNFSNEVKNKIFINILLKFYVENKIDFKAMDLIISDINTEINSEKKKINYDYILNNNALRFLSLSKLIEIYKNEKLTDIKFQEIASKLILDNNTTSLSEIIKFVFSIKNKPEIWGKLLENNLSKFSIENTYNLYFIKKLIIENLNGDKNKDNSIKILEKLNINQLKISFGDFLLFFEKNINDINENECILKYNLEKYRMNSDDFSKLLNFLQKINGYKLKLKYLKCVLRQNILNYDYKNMSFKEFFNIVDKFINQEIEIIEKNKNNSNVMHNIINALVSEEVIKYTTINYNPNYNPDEKQLVIIKKIIQGMYSEGLLPAYFKNKEFFDNNDLDDLCKLFVPLVPPSNIGNSIINGIKSIFNDPKIKQDEYEQNIKNCYYSLSLLNSNIRLDGISLKQMCYLFFNDYFASVNKSAIFGIIGWRMVDVFKTIFEKYKNVSKNELSFVKYNYRKEYDQYVGKNISFNDDANITIEELINYYTDGYIGYNSIKNKLLLQSKYATNKLNTKELINLINTLTKKQTNIIVDNAVNGYLIEDEIKKQNKELAGDLIKYLLDYKNISVKELYDAIEKYDCFDFENFIYFLGKKVCVFDVKNNINNNQLNCNLIDAKTIEDIIKKIQKNDKLKKEKKINSCINSFLGNIYFDSSTLLIWFEKVFITLNEKKTSLIECLPEKNICILFFSNLDNINFLANILNGIKSKNEKINAIVKSIDKIFSYKAQRDELNFSLNMLIEQCKNDDQKLQLIINLLFIKDKTKNPLSDCCDIEELSKISEECIENNLKNLKSISDKIKNLYILNKNIFKFFKFDKFKNEFNVIYNICEVESVKNTNLALNSLNKAQWIANLFGIEMEKNKIENIEEIKKKKISEDKEGKEVQFNLSTLKQIYLFIGDIKERSNIKVMRILKQFTELLDVNNLTIDEIKELFEDDNRNQFFDMIIDIIKHCQNDTNSIAYELFNKKIRLDDFIKFDNLLDNNYCKYGNWDYSSSRFIGCFGYSQIEELYAAFCNKYKENIGNESFKEALKSFINFDKITLEELGKLIDKGIIAFKRNNEKDMEYINKFLNNSNNMGKLIINSKNSKLWKNILQENFFIDGNKKNEKEENSENKIEKKKENFNMIINEFQITDIDLIAKNKIVENDNNNTNKNVEENLKGNKLKIFDIKILKQLENSRISNVHFENFHIGDKDHSCKIFGSNNFDNSEFDNKSNINVIIDDNSCKHKLNFNNTNITCPFVISFGKNYTYSSKCNISFNNACISGITMKINQDEHYINSVNTNKKIEIQFHNANISNTFFMLQHNKNITNNIINMNFTDANIGENVLVPVNCFYNKQIIINEKIEKELDFWRNIIGEEKNFSNDHIGKKCWVDVKYLKDILFCEDSEKHKLYIELKVKISNIYSASCNLNLKNKEEKDKTMKKIAIICRKIFNNLIIKENIGLTLEKFKEKTIGKIQLFDKNINYNDEKELQHEIIEEDKTNSYGKNLNR